VGHARLIIERFGRFWGAFSVGDLFILNFLTIVTEFIGVSLALAHFGVSPTVSVPLAAVALVAVTVTGSFRRWERFMYVLIAANFVVIPLAVMSHPSIGPVMRDTVVPGIKGGVTATALLLIIAMVGTTVAPWQLFFQQSNVIDKRLTPRWMGYERADTVIGSFVVIVGAAAMIIATAFAFEGTHLAGNFVDAGTVTTGLAQRIGPLAGTLFAIVLLNASLIGAAAVTLSTTYAFGDVFGMKHSLHRSWRDALGFYGIYTALVVVAGGIVLIPHAPLGLMTTAVQALAGILLPSATVFLLLLCNDTEVLGPWVNRAWTNALASAIVGVLVMLSLILAAATLFPALNIPLVTIVLGVILAVALLGMGFFRLCAMSVRVVAPVPSIDRASWRMPALSTLSRPVWSPQRKIGMLTLRIYLVIAVGLMTVKVVQLALGG